MSFEECERRKENKYKFIEFIILTFFFSILGSLSVCGFKLPSGVTSNTAILSAIQLYCLFCAATVSYITFLCYRTCNTIISTLYYKNFLFKSIKRKKEINYAFILHFIIK